MTNKTSNPFESKLSHIPITNPADVGEFESAKTLMPGQSAEVNEINALMGQDRSMADLATSIQSPGGPTNRSKLNVADNEASSLMPGNSSNYAAHQHSFRDEESLLGNFALGASPDMN